MPHSASGAARLALMVWSLCWAPLAAAQSSQVSLPAAMDTTIFNSGDDVADAQGDFLWTSVLASGGVRRALIKFDLSVIPAGATVTEVRLELYQSRARGAHDVTVHRLLSSWGEGPSNGGGQGAGAPAGPGDATWRYRFYPAMPWSAEGGDFVAAPSATLFVGASSQWYAWISRSLEQGGPNRPLLDDVRRWLADPGQNHGWVLIGDETADSNAKRFQGGENTASPPRLIVLFNPPAEQESHDGDVPLPLWAIALLATLIGGVMVRSDHQRRR